MSLLNTYSLVVSQILIWLTLYFHHKTVSFKRAQTLFLVLTSIQPILRLWYPAHGTLLDEWVNKLSPSLLLYAVITIWSKPEIRAQIFFFFFQFGLHIMTKITSWDRLAWFAAQLGITQRAASLQSRKGKLTNFYGLRSHTPRLIYRNSFL